MKTNSPTTSKDNAMEYIVYYMWHTDGVAQVA